MQPTRTEEHALVELLDVLLERGVVIQADIVVTVTDIPLVGISLRAAIAGIAKMSEYGGQAGWNGGNALIRIGVSHYRIDRTTPCSRPGSRPPDRCGVRRLRETFIERREETLPP